MRPFHLPKIYPITDTGISGLSHREQAERLIAGGAEIIQLRDKNASLREFYEVAKLTLEFTRQKDVPLIINDRVDIALALKADGVHLGQDDLPPDQARKLLGDEAIIGFSTHSVEQALQAANVAVDYVAIGPIFTTKTKEDPDTVVGPDGLRAVRKAVGNLALVAIGGIGEGDLSSMFGAGADSVAVITALLAEPVEIEARMREFAQIASKQP